MMTAPTAGLGFRPGHFDEALACPVGGLWFEVQAGDYLAADGPLLAVLDAMACRFPLSLHGLGLSVAGVERPCARQLASLRALVDRYQPLFVSEHLAVSRIGARCAPDPLPIPRSREMLAVAARNIEIAQCALGRRILVENPALLALGDGHDWSEPGFLAELARRTGCGLLVDVANIVASAGNLGFDPYDYVSEFPPAAVAELHLGSARAGLAVEGDDAPVSGAVWSLFGYALDRFGPRPTIIERDGKTAAFDSLMTERGFAAALLDDFTPAAGTCEPAYA